jgi:hypothetical protein
MRVTFVRSTGTLDAVNGTAQVFLPAHLDTLAERAQVPPPSEPAESADRTGQTCMMRWGNASYTEHYRP